MGDTKASDCLKSIFKLFQKLSCQKITFFKASCAKLLQCTTDLIIMGHASFFPGDPDALFVKCALQAQHAFQ